MPTKRQFTIGQLARAAQVPVSTLRYYERIGLVEPDDRSAGNYRIYGLGVLRRLQFIRAAQSIGFLLEDVRALLGPEDGRTLSCREVQHLIDERLADIDSRLESLRHIQAVLRSSLKKCRTTNQPGCCHVIDVLQNTSVP